MIIHKVAAELVGTFILVFLGGLSVLSAVAAGIPPFVVAPWGFGLGLLTAIYAVGHLSGGHFNPAVSIAAFFDRQIEFGDFVGYVIAQFAGGVVAALALMVVDGRAGVALTQTGFPEGKAWSAFVIELLLTAIFVLVILVVTQSDTRRAPLAISFALVAISFAGIPLSGASANPARSFGPALVGLPSGRLGVYFAGPILGGVLGYLLTYLFKPANN